MFRNPSRISAQDTFIWLLYSLNVCILAAAFLLDTYWLAGLSILCSAAVLVLRSYRKPVRHHEEKPLPDLSMRSSALAAGASAESPATDTDGWQTGACQEWVAHAAFPKHISQPDLRLVIGGGRCRQPYNASLLNSDTGEHQQGARLTTADTYRFARNTGQQDEWLAQPADQDLIWQIGPAYTACRSEDGRFHAALFKKHAARTQVRMIELSLSMPAGDLPLQHTAFQHARSLMLFTGFLRDLSEAKPIGIRMRMGHRQDFTELCAAMIETGIVPDFITLEDAHQDPMTGTMLGMPLSDALAFCSQTLRTYGLREHIRVLAAGPLRSGYDVLKNLALGADACYIQPPLHDANPSLQEQHQQLMESTVRLMERCGFQDVHAVTPDRFFYRHSPLQCRSLEEIYFNNIDNRLTDQWFKAYMLN